MDRICESINKCVTYLKQEYGVEHTLFSFNEPDTGVQVLQTPEEHLSPARKLGQYSASHAPAMRGCCRYRSARGSMSSAWALPALWSGTCSVAT
jgi:hypothetical protein